MPSRLGLTEALLDLLEGRVAPKDADPRILNWAEFHIHKGAQEILSLPTLADRAKALEKVPATVRPYVEREAKRIWELRKAK
jgi:hypothetical protein